MGVLSEAFDVLVLRFGVQKRIYCNVSPRDSPFPPPPGGGMGVRVSQAIRLHF